MAANKRTKEQREIDLATVARLMHRGWSKRRIARHLQLDEKQVRYDWKECQRRLDRDRNTDVAGRRREFGAMYEEITVEAWQGWDDSKKDREKRTAEMVTSGGTGTDGKPKKERNKSVKIVEGRLADPEYLRIVLEATNRRAEIEDVKPARRIAGPGGDQGDAIQITIVEPVKPDPKP